MHGRVRRITLYTIIIYRTSIILCCKLVTARSSPTLLPHQTLRKCIHACAFGACACVVADVGTGDGVVGIVVMARKRRVRPTSC